MVELRGDERLDYLLAENMRIIQSPSVFSFSLDAVLLARFSYLPVHRGKVVDLCSGNGIIPLLLSARTKVEITGIEIQDRLLDMAERSIAYNHLEEQVSMKLGDVKEIDKLLHHSHYDVVTCNPPYFETPPGNKKNDNEHYAIARHEILCSLEDTIKAASYLLKQGGKASFVHRPSRLMDILSLMRKHRLEPKRLRFVYPKPGKEANTILVEGIKDGKPDLKVLPPLYVYNEKSEYSMEVHEILYGKE